MPEKSINIVLPTNIPPTHKIILTTMPTTTPSYDDKKEVVRENFSHLTPTMLPTLKPTVTITPTVDWVLYSKQWSTYFEKSLNISFEYPKYYDFPVQDQFWGEMDWCKPQKHGNEIYVSDWITIAVDKITEAGVTPSPYDWYLKDWTIQSEKYIDVDGISTLLIAARKVMVFNENGNAADYYYSMFACFIKDQTLYSFTYRTVPIGTPRCMYNYRTNDVNIFLHILETFKVDK